MPVDIDTLVILLEMGFTIDNVAMSFAVTEQQLDELTTKHHGERCKDLAERVRSAGPIHLLAMAYRAANNDNRVLLYLLDRLWKNESGETKKPDLDKLTDDQLAQIHKIVRQAMT